MASISKFEKDRIWKHIETTNHELKDVKEDIASIKTDIYWVKYIVLANLGAIVGLAFKVILS